MVRRRRSATRYASRSLAGQLLADALVAEAVLEKPIVLALPRGGIPVAAEVAAQLLSLRARFLFVEPLAERDVKFAVGPEREPRAEVQAVIVRRHGPKNNTHLLEVFAVRG